jgi:NAD(P)-dependent dehydrogenase (short-subunit alcohol dehydrogenase family)
MEKRVYGLKDKKMGTNDSLQGKIALVTGSSSGIGRDTVKKLAREGCKVVITYNHHKKEGEKVLDECREYSEAELFHLDVTDEELINRVRIETIEKFDRLDILINNAGVLSWKRLVDQSMEEIAEQINVNLQGVVQMARAFLPQFYKQNEGVILNISSGAGRQGFSNMTVYCATKFGVRGFTQALAKELPKNIRTSCVNPPVTATHMTNYEGVGPLRVAEVVVQSAAEQLGKTSGDDIDIWEYI